MNKETEASALEVRLRHANEELTDLRNCNENLEKEKQESVALLEKREVQLSECQGDFAHFVFVNIKTF
jgi:hypothetical protein